MHAWKGTLLSADLDMGLKKPLLFVDKRKKLGPVILRLCLTFCASKHVAYWRAHGILYPVDLPEIPGFAM